MTRGPLRFVLDTNVWLDWLVFRDPAIAPLKAAVAAGTAEIYVSEESIVELARVLGYELRKAVLTAESQAACLVECGRIAKKHDVRSTAGTKSLLPVCSDPDDQKFLELAHACGAAFLVTKDRALLELARHGTRPVPFRIVGPQALDMPELAGAAGGIDQILR